MGQKLTDKKLRNKRFRETEKAILIAFFSSEGFLNVGAIARRAQISRSTLYRHHKVVCEIGLDYEEYILRKYNFLIERIMEKRKIKIRTVYHQTLIFILKNKEIFGLMIRRSNGYLIEKMIKKVEPRIKEIYKLPKNCNKILRIYRKEITGLIEDWIKNDFVEDEIAILDDIVYLTEIMRLRLMPLVR